MTNLEQKNQIIKKSNIATIPVVVGGAIVGAGVALAGSFILKNEKSRTKLKEVLKVSAKLALKRFAQLKLESTITKENKTDKKIKKLITTSDEIKKS